MLLYAAPVWTRVLREADWAKLRSAQRSALLVVTQAYRTTSTDALTVIAGRPPIDLKAKAVCAAWELANGYQPCVPVQSKEEVDAWLIEEWQRRWDSTPKGRHTYRLLNSIKDRLAMKHLTADHYTSQFLTGHGDFSAKLHSLGLKDSPLCECGMPETVDHVALECERYTVLRTKWIYEVEVDVASMDTVRRAISTRAGYKATEMLWKAVMRQKGWPA